MLLDAGEYQVNLRSEVGLDGFTIDLEFASQMLSDKTAARMIAPSICIRVMVIGCICNLNEDEIDPNEMQ